MPDTWRVFAQETQPRVNADAWTRAAARFFGAKLVVTATSASACTITLDGTTRRIDGRQREEADLREALAADNRAGFTGLYDLAERRCPTIWVVEREGATDRVGLLIAAILASVCLGPILGDEALFGVRTAREKLVHSPP
jgi:hypothetical protein